MLNLMLALFSTKNAHCLAGIGCELSDQTCFETNNCRFQLSEHSLHNDSKLDIKVQLSDEPGSKRTRAKRFLSAELTVKEPGFLKSIDIIAAPASKMQFIH